ncbi:hypothetical protein BCM02_11525 [Paenibacillus methanolicus]|uniref:Uncharacterized protein n=1 Tax=Paenibacillus methanolicus TaxID=582686 RepID=A0A5S5BQ91_9BACL|nr:hypothetical protein BCM02_11525 [Paenibacillus methanolicus]
MVNVMAVFKGIGFGVVAIGMVPFMFAKALKDSFGPML